MTRRLGRSVLVAVVAVAGCGTQPRSPVAARPGPGDRVAAPAPASTAELEIEVVVDEAYFGFAPERLPIDTSAFAAAVRGCVDVHLPAASRPAEGRWLVGVSWTEYSASPEPEEARARSLVPYLEPPEPLSRCVAALAPPHTPAGTEVFALVAIHTPGWVAAHGAGTPVDDPDRYWQVQVRVREELLDGTSRSAPTFQDNVMREPTRRCAEGLMPLASRPQEHGFTVTLRWDNPAVEQTYRSMGGGFGTGGGGDDGWTKLHPFAEAPDGFADCARATVQVRPSDFVSDVAAITATVQVVTAAFARRHFVGTIGHGNPPP